MCTGNVLPFSMLATGASWREAAINGQYDENRLCLSVVRAVRQGEAW
jgi:hypothetical protein